MDFHPDYRGSDEVAYGVDSLALALSIRDSQAPEPFVTEISAQESDAVGPSLGEAGIVMRILAGVCIALVIAFIFVVARGL